MRPREALAALVFAERAIRDVEQRAGLAKAQVLLEAPATQGVICVVICCHEQQRGHIGPKPSMAKEAILGDDAPKTHTYHGLPGGHDGQPMTDDCAFRLREWRRARKLTQEQIAEVLGANKSTIGKYERGERDPSISTICAIAAFMEILPGDLFRNPDEPSFDRLAASLSLDAKQRLLKPFQAMVETYRQG